MLYNNHLDLTLKNFWLHLLCHCRQAIFQIKDKIPDLSVPFLSFNVHLFKVVKTIDISQEQVFTFYYKIKPVTPLSMSSRKPQMKPLVFESTIGFSLKNNCLLMSSTSKNFGFVILENQSLKVSMVNLSSTENNLAMEVDFQRANTAEAASFNWWKVVLIKKRIYSRFKWLINNLISCLLKTTVNNDLI